MPHLDEPLAAPVVSPRHLVAEARFDWPHAIARHHIPVEPSRAVAGDLLLEVEGERIRTLRPSPAWLSVVCHAPVDDVTGHPPMVGIDAFDMAGAA